MWTRTKRRDMMGMCVLSMTRLPCVSLYSQGLATAPVLFAAEEEPKLKELIGRKFREVRFTIMYMVFFFQSPNDI